MLHSNRVRSTAVLGFAALVVMLAGELHAQGSTNPYTAVDGWEKLPDGRGLRSHVRGIPRSRWQAPLGVESMRREHMCR